MAISWHLLRFALCARTVCERYWLASSPLSLQTDWIAAAFRPRCCQLIWIFLPPPPISYFLFRIVSGGRSNQQPAFVYGSAMATAAWRPGPAACYSARFTTAAAVWRSGSFSIKRRTAQTPGAVRKAPVSLPFSLSLSLLTAITTRLTNKRSLFYYRTRSV